MCAVFYLDPVWRLTVAIWAIAPLRDQAFPYHPE
jgi:hypothetical protein